VVLSKKDGKELLEEFSPGYLKTKNLFNIYSYPRCIITVTYLEKLIYGYTIRQAKTEHYYLPMFLL
jgi:hypothetical protein